jgi:hypothetical protein
MSAASYGFAQIPAPSPSTEIPSAAVAATDITVAASPLILPSASFEFIEMLSAVSDATMLFATGVALIGLAAGVRRHTC